MSLAWHIRRDGKEFPVDIHYYAEIENPEEILNLSVWLYNNSSYASTRKSAIRYIDTYCYTYYQDYEIGKVHSILIGDLSYLTDFAPLLTENFLLSISSQLADLKPYDRSIESLSQLLVLALDQEFIRVRFGGFLNSDDTGRQGEMVFRVSSTGFNWLNIIYKFVLDHRDIIKYVTVCRDLESDTLHSGGEWGRTGDWKFYKHKGKTIYRIPLDEFLTLPGNPSFESLNGSYEGIPLTLNSQLVMDRFGKKLKKELEGYQKLEVLVNGRK